MINTIKNKNGNRFLSAYRFVPNMITIAALCIGLTAIKKALAGDYEFAAALVIMAAFLDMIDGAVARLLKATSDFGAQLDSFSDFVSFGIAPALILYLWTLSDAKGFGWLATLLLCAVVALRLARFNVQYDKKKLSRRAGHTESYFEGVPSPAGALLALLPLFGSLYSADIVVTPHGVAGWCIVVSILMISKIPTLSLKRLRIQQKYSTILLTVVALTVAVIFSEPWLTLCILLITYLLTILYTHYRHNVLVSKSKNNK